MRKIFGDILCDNLTDGEYIKLRKMKRRKERDNYKIVITSDRRSYDDLTELANHPEKGKRVGTFYFRNPDELDLIVKAFEGLFYITFEIKCLSKLVLRLEKIGSGVIDSLIYEDWLNKECCKICDLCFLRGESINGDWTCKRSLK